MITIDMLDPELVYHARLSVYYENKDDYTRRKISHATIELDGYYVNLRRVEHYHRHDLGGLELDAEDKAIIRDDLWQENLGPFDAEQRAADMDGLWWDEYSIHFTSDDGDDGNDKRDFILELFNACDDDDDEEEASPVTSTPGTGHWKSR